MKNTTKLSAVVLSALVLVGIFSFVTAANTTTPISLSEVSQHNSRTDCWSVIDGKVYDLTDYVSNHPGGSSVSVICGIDGTYIFDGQHPSSYLGLISSYQIGVLAVQDTTAPLITLIGSKTININVGDSYTDSGATASDNVDGDLTSEIITVNPVDSEIAGNYLIRYEVSDSSGNKATASRNVIVTAIAEPEPTPTPTPTPNPQPEETPGSGDSGGNGGNDVPQESPGNSDDDNQETPVYDEDDDEDDRESRSDDNDDREDSSEDSDEEEHEQSSSENSKDEDDDNNDRESDSKESGRGDNERDDDRENNHEDED